jgi:shikimate kinase
MGMMGSGKSTVGQELSRRTGWPYLDNDELLKMSTGRSAAEVLADQGETGLREAEAAALALGMKAQPPCFVGIAAGTILGEENRLRLEQGVVVWLRATPETLHERAAGAAHRPWLDRGGVQWFRTTLDERWPLYDDAADITLDVDEPSPDELAELILDRLAQQPACNRQLAEVYDRIHAPPD